MKLILKSLLLVSLFIATSINSWAQSEEIQFEIDISSPMIRAGQLGDLFTLFTNPGAVIYHEGRFHMFRPAFLTWGARANVDYMTSSDGLNWASFQEEPIFSHTQVPFDAMAMPTSAIVDLDGTWHMYFFLVPRSGSATGGIVEAVAPNPWGPWEMPERMLVDVGPTGDWDSRSLPAPRVIRIGAQYVMYYGGQHDSSGDTLIGMATSPDGIQWTKYNDPTTTEAPYAESDPVFRPNLESAPWENSRIVQDPRIVKTEDGYVMMYSSYNGFRPTTSHAYGLAFSEDGINWERRIDYPVFSGHDVKNRITWFHELAYADGTYYMYVAIAGAGGGNTNIYGGIYDGPMPARAANSMD